MKRYTYGRDQKLKSRSEIKKLFEEGKWYSCGPLRMIILVLPTEEDSQRHRAGVSVAKRNFKKATDRNRIKRLLREAYRHLQEDFCNAVPGDALLLFSWGEQMMPASSQEVMAVMARLLQRYKEKNTTKP